MHTFEILQLLKSPLLPPSREASIGAHVLEATRQLSRPAYSVEEILGAHPIGDDILGGTNASDVSIDTANSKEVRWGSHNMTPYKPHTSDLPQNHRLDSLYNFKDQNISLKANNVTNNVTNTPTTNILNQDNQDYYNWRDQQYIGCKYNGGLEQVKIQLVPDIILEKEEEEDGFINGLTSMINE